MSDVEFNRRLGRGIAEARRAAGMTRQDFAIATGLRYTLVGTCERGEITMHVNRLQQFADALGVTSVSLLRATAAVSGEFLR